MSLGFLFEGEGNTGRGFSRICFKDPEEILVLEDPSDLKKYFERLEKLSKHYWLAGFLSYELGYLLEEKFHIREKCDFPYAVFGIYCRPSLFREPDNADFNIAGLNMEMDFGQYRDKIEKLKSHIAAGNIYQANFTFKYRFDFSGSSYSLYHALKKHQGAGYNVYAKFGDYRILSLSPELFFSYSDGMITVKPMKGTFKRGVNPEEDNKNMKFLREDVKNRSENLMIVDLLRNDLARISRYGTVTAENLFEVEKYNTILQMTSTISSRMKSGTGFYPVLKALFPSGSVTGAPKIRSMEIINELEKEDRRIYTGALGYVEPGASRACFNVAIRTILIKNSRGEMGVGGGIVHDSEPEKEYEECRLKAGFLCGISSGNFRLVETLLYDGELKDEELHMDRMKRSADYFKFKFTKRGFMKAVDAALSGSSQGRSRVRVLLDRSGKFIVQLGPAEETAGELEVGISNLCVDSYSPFLYHKTTNRGVYDAELESGRKKGLFDVIFFNEKDQLTEGAISNIYVEIEGKLYTPSEGCGLLNGTVRSRLLREGKCIEKIITREMVYNNTAGIYISNSLIGLRRAVIRNVTKY